MIRWMVGVAAFAMSAAYVLPLWRIALVAPQYPEGLGMRIRVNGIIESRKRRKMALGDCVAMDDGPSLILVEKPPLPSD